MVHTVIASHFTLVHLQEGIVNLVRPTVEAIDERVGETRKAQAELRDNIELLSRDLEAIRAAQEDPSLRSLDLESAINKLNESKKRVVVVANLLKGAQDRLNRVHQGGDSIDILDGLNLSLNPSLNHFFIQCLPKRVLNLVLNPSLRF